MADNEPDDFVDLIGHLTNFVQNERVKSYNEAVDMMLQSAREWLRLNGAAPQGDNMPDLLDEIAEHARKTAPR